MIILIGGPSGAGKTYQCMAYDEPLAYADCEYPRADEIRKRHYPAKLIDIKQCREYYKTTTKDHKKGQIDIEATYQALMESVTAILDKSQDYSTIVIDGISDIRTDIVAPHWLSEYNKKNPDKKRKVIGKDPGAWSHINKIVGDEILFPLINTGRMENKTIIFTSKLADEYRLVKTDEGKEEQTKTGKQVLDAINWVAYEMDITCELTKSENGRYYAAFPKTPVGVIPKVDITGKTVYDVLSERGLV